MRINLTIKLNASFLFAPRQVTVDFITKLIKRFSLEITDQQEICNFKVNSD